MCMARGDRQTVRLCRMTRNYSRSPSPPTPAMPRNSKHAKGHHHVDTARLDIAHQAARLMAEDGIDSFGLAKRKAAKQLGIPESDALPTNQEIEDALRAYQSVFQEDELRERLILLRRDALTMMRQLEMFNPYLTGPALEGIAGRYTEAEIQLFADSAKDVEIFLLNKGISFEHADIRHNGPNAPETRLRLDGEESSLLLSIYPRTLERIHRRNQHTGKVDGRAGIEAVTALLAQTSQT